MIRRPPRSTQSRSSAASDVYKRQEEHVAFLRVGERCIDRLRGPREDGILRHGSATDYVFKLDEIKVRNKVRVAIERGEIRCRFGELRLDIGTALASPV